MANNNCSPALNEAQATQKSSIWATVLAFKSLLVTVSLVGLLATNVATVVNSTAHNWMHRFLWTALSIGGDLFANKAMSDSPKMKADQKLKTQTADLEAKNNQLVSANANQAKQLDELNVHNKKLAHQLETNGKLAKETVSKVHRRLTESVLRNIASLPTESVPFIGVAFVIGATSMDIYDACQTMKDFNVLLVRLGEGQEKPDFCGQKVPSVEEIKESIKNRFRKREAG